MNNVYSVFATNLRDEILARGWTQDRFAELCDTTQGRVNSWLKGTIPRKEKLEVIGKVIGRDPIMLFIPKGFFHNHQISLQAGLSRICDELGFLEPVPKPNFSSNKVLNSLIQNVPHETLALFPKIEKWDFVHHTLETIIKSQEARDKKRAKSDEKKSS